MNASAVQQEARTSPSAASRPVYDGRLAELYAIYLRHLVLMLLTLGWSRFWGRTRLRRYLWNHFAILGDRFEYRGRGIELCLGFVLVLLILAGGAALAWLAWHFEIEARAPPGFTVFHLYILSLAVVGFPLAFVGHYAGLRYRLSRTRWRGIRGALAGSAWNYGALATLLTVANALSGRLLTPLVSVTLARPRIANAAIGTQRLAFAGRAGDIWGRYLGYYFLNIVVWIVLLAVAGGVLGGLIVAWATHGGTGEDARRQLEALGRGQMLLLIGGLLLVGYTIFGLAILPLRCWWQAYLLRYLVARTQAGDVRFATSLTTGQMWGFLVLNYLIVLLSFGLGWPWVMHRTLRLIAGTLWLYGAPAPGTIRQPADRGPRTGEGLLDMFDVSGV